MCRSRWDGLKIPYTILQLYTRTNVYITYTVSQNSIILRDSLEMSIWILSTSQKKWKKMYIFKYAAYYVYIYIYFLINVRIKWSKKAVPSYLLMILNLSENNWKLFPSWIFIFFFFYATERGVLAKRPFYQYLLKVNNNKTTNDLTRVRAHCLCGGRTAVGKKLKVFFRILSLFLYS